MSITPWEMMQAMQELRVSIATGRTTIERPLTEKEKSSIISLRDTQLAAERRKKRSLNEH